MSNSGPIIELHKQTPNGDFAMAATTQVNLEQFTPGLFTQSGNAPAGTYFIRRKGIDAHVPMIAVVNNTVVPAALNLTTEIDSAYALIMYTTGGAYPLSRNPASTFKVKFAGIDAPLGYVDFYGESSFSKSVQQFNFILNASEIIKRGLAFGQFTKLEIFDQSGALIGSAEIRFTNNP